MDHSPPRLRGGGGGGWNVSHCLSPLLFPSGQSAVMLWPVDVQTVPQASKNFCPARLQTRCDICCACLSICLSIPFDSDSQGLQKSLQPKTVYRCVPVRAANPRLHLFQQVPCVCENDGMCHVCVTLVGQPL